MTTHVFRRSFDPVRGRSNMRSMGVLLIVAAVGYVTGAVVQNSLPPSSDPVAFAQSAWRRNRARASFSRQQRAWQRYRVPLSCVDPTPASRSRANATWQREFRPSAYSWTSSF